MKIREIVTKNVQRLSPDMTIGEAMKRLAEKDISGLPVVNPEGVLLGMLTEKEVLAYLLPSYLDRLGKFVYEESPKAIGKKLCELGAIKVK